MSRNNVLHKSRTIKAKDVVTVTAIAGLGYLLLTHGSPGPTGGGGSAGTKKEGVTGVIADELGGLGITTPNYTINLPGGGGQSIVFPDFPLPPPIDTTPIKPGKNGIDWSEIIPDVNLNLPEIVGTIGKGYVKTPKPKIGTGTGMFGKVSAAFNAFSLAKIFLQTVIPQTSNDRVQGTGQILTKKGRSARVKAFKEKYKVPKDYNYPITRKPIKVL